jgi:NADH:ubiquinone oxidoreductase subunit 6 (subunit J)
MILEVFAAGMVISACFAIFLDEAVYSVAALSATFALTALLYAVSGALFVAIFQFAVAVGTLAILFLSGEMLSEKPTKRTSWKNVLPVLAVGVVLSLPMMIFSISSTNNVPFTVSFGEALWNLRAIDVVLQGLVIMTVAMGIIIVLHEKRNGEK